MKNLEFYITPTGEIMIHDDNGTHTLSQKDREFMSSMISRLNDFYPEALSARHELPVLL